MQGRYKRKPIGLPPEALNPLDFAIAKRAEGTMDMVQEAISHKQTLLAFQPVMRSDASGKIAFYEGLIRVLDPTGRIIPAGDFMGKIEDTETGREIDVLALRHGLNTLKHNPTVRLSINMSARSIGYRPWMNCLNRFLNESPYLGERLILEITESSAMLVPELVIDFMERLQPKGICFAMDDFGAGNMAIRYFKDFDFDILKISGQFIRGLSKDPDNLAITRALCAIAKEFDMLTVAESVETYDDATLAIQTGIDCLQGYYFAAPTTRPDWFYTQASSKQA